MIIVAGHLTIDPAHTDILRSALSDMIETTRQEQGCVQYVFSSSLTDPAHVRVFEIWESSEDLAAHGVAPHMTTFREAMANVTVLERALTTYDATATGTL